MQEEQANEQGGSVLVTTVRNHALEYNSKVEQEP